MAVGEPDECWPWKGKADKDGYGNLLRKIDGIRYQRAHRVAYRIATGIAPGNLLVLHTCDNPTCCNPAHLWLGTSAQNNADRKAKGRYIQPSGDEHWTRRMPERVMRGEYHWAKGGVPQRRGAVHHNIKLTDDQVREIRARFAAGGVLQYELAAEYGVSRGHVSAIILRKFREHVPDVQA